MLCYEWNFLVINKCSRPSCSLLDHPFNGLTKLIRSIVNVTKYLGQISNLNRTFFTTLSYSVCSFVKGMNTRFGTFVIPYTSL